MASVLPITNSYSENRKINHVQVYLPDNIVVHVIIALTTIRREKNWLQGSQLLKVNGVPSYHSLSHNYLHTQSDLTHASWEAGCACQKGSLMLLSQQKAEELDHQLKILALSQEMHQPEALCTQCVPKQHLLLYYIYDLFLVLQRSLIWRSLKYWFLWM